MGMLWIRLAVANRQPDTMAVLQRRTSYFPGLGWMLRREVWLEISSDFPDQAWDHWMRLNTTSKGKLHPCCTVLYVSKWVLKGFRV